MSRGPPGLGHARDRFGGDLRPARPVRLSKPRRITACVTFFCVVSGCGSVRSCVISAPRRHLSGLTFGWHKGALTEASESDLQALLTGATGLGTTMRTLRLLSWAHEPFRD